MQLAGKLDRKINIRYAPGTLSDAGEATAAGAYLAEGVWAGVSTPKGRELQSGGRDGAVVDKVFRVRYLATITESMIVEFGGADWRIIWFDEIGRTEALDLHTQKVR